MLDIKEAGDITLAISYLVTGAKWLPKYDIRAFSNESVIKVRDCVLVTKDYTCLACLILFVD